MPEQIATVRWLHERSEFERRAISVGLIAALAIGLGFVDSSLGFAVATIGALVYLPKLAALPRLVVEICLVAVYAYPEPSLHTQGTAAAPGATDYIVTPNVDISVVSDQLQRDFRRTSLDKLPHVIGKRSVMVKFQTELKNSGVAGTEYAPLSAAIQAWPLNLS